MNDRHVVVTGASSGIGAALTRALSADGYKLYVCARRADRLDEVTDRGQFAFSMACDVSDKNQVDAFFNEIIARTDSIYALINCAGGFGAIGPMIDTDGDAWWDTLRVNVLGPYLTIKRAVPMMREGARIVNFSGGGAFGPFPNYSAYAVSKSAIVRMTETLALELAGRGIGVNAVAPGFVLTEIHNSTLRAGPEAAGDEHFRMTLAKKENGAVPVEIPINLVRWMLSPASAGLTGKTISASFDPWDTSEFADRIREIVDSDLYTMRRVNLKDIEPIPLRDALLAAKRKPSA